MHWTDIDWLAECNFSWSNGAYKKLEGTKLWRLRETGPNRFTLSCTDPRSYSTFEIWHEKSMLEIRQLFADLNLG